ncbi:MAG TPA: hypothetical protein VJI96_01595 [Candidatus Andersenbacteria bacterium]|nr:hypothetical protein [Candidatus Andersenbacteria bacterium]
MSRVVSRPSYFFSYAFSAYVFVVAFAISLLFAPSAYADPHAVFYTDRAQEQLFYNTLAALNQADFVEPTDGQFGRDILLSRRASVTQQNPQPVVSSNTPLFGQEQNPLIAETKTVLPAILSRSITLEGNDLWTAYLVNQLALETKTRRSVSELARIYCTSGLGREGCSTQPGRSQQQENAFINDIAVYNPEAEALLGGLSDGLAQELDFRERLTKPATSNSIAGQNRAATPAQTSIASSQKVARPNFTDVAQIRKNNQGNQGNLDVFNNLTGGVISAFFNPGIDVGALSDITIKKDDGKVTIPKDIKFAKYMQIVSGLGSIPHGTIDNAIIAMEEGEAARKNREDTRSLADTVLTRDSSGAVKEIIQAPSSAKVALIENEAALIANSDINQKTAAATEQTIPGNTPALQVQRDVLKVKGISTQGNQEVPLNGEVAGIISDLYDKYYNKPSTSTINPNTGLVQPHDEGGTYEALQALTGDRGIREDPQDPEKKCGFCIALDTIIGTQGALEIIQGVYNDIYCVFFPSSEACIKKDA